MTGLIITDLPDGRKAINGRPVFSDAKRIYPIVHFEGNAESIHGLAPRNSQKEGSVEKTTKSATTSPTAYQIICRAACPHCAAGMKYVPVIGRIGSSPVHEVWDCGATPPGYGYFVCMAPSKDAVIDQLSAQLVESRDGKDTLQMMPNSPTKHTLVEQLQDTITQLSAQLAETRKALEKVREQAKNLQFCLSTGRMDEAGKRMARILALMDGEQPGDQVPAGVDTKGKKLRTGCRR